MPYYMNDKFYIFLFQSAGEQENGRLSTRERGANSSFRENPDDQSKNQSVTHNI